MESSSIVEKLHEELGEYEKIVNCKICVNSRKQVNLFFLGIYRLLSIFSLEIGNFGNILVFNICACFQEYINNGEILFLL